MTALRLPELFHVGWVVRDCQAAQEELHSRLGAGPFVSAGPESRFEHALVHGHAGAFSLRIAFGVLGGVLLELLEPLDDRSPHAEFLAAHGEGLHHLAFLVDDFDEQVAAARRAAPPMDLLVDGTGPGNRVRWVYLDGGDGGGDGDGDGDGDNADADVDAARGTVIELIESSELSLAAFAPFLELVGR